MKNYIVLCFLMLIAYNSIAQDSFSNQKKELEQLLENIKKPGVYPGQLFNYPKEIFNFFNIRKRLLEVLSNKWTNDEIEAWIQNDFAKYEFQRKYEEELAKEIATKGQMPYKRALDSLQNIRRAQVRKELEAKPVNPELILAAGWLDMQEAISILKKASKDQKHYNIETVELSLARLGVEPYRLNTIKKLTTPKPVSKADLVSDYYERARKLFFICSQESVYAATYWLFKKEKVQPLDHDPILIPLANYAALDFSDLILNLDFQKVSNPDRYISAMSIKQADLEFIRNWILANKGKLKLNMKIVYLNALIN